MKTWATFSLAAVALLGAGMLAAREDKPTPADPAAVVQLSHRWPAPAGAAAPGRTSEKAIEAAHDQVSALRTARDAVPPENPVAAADAATPHVRFM
ncbi:MAG: hypothetical protein U1E59_04560 [Amaricoccus sp.]